MNKKQLFLMVMVLVGGVMSPILTAHAQDDLQTTLDTLTTAYQNAAALQSYAAQWDGTTSESTQLSEGDNLYIVSTQITSAQTAQIEGANTSSSVTQTVTQGQIVVTKPLVEGAALPEPTLASQLELKASLVSIDGRVFINLDETAPEYRAGLPEGWQEVRDGVALGVNGTVSLTDVAASLDNVRMDATSVLALLNPTVVKSAEALPDDELNGQAMKRYLLTLNLAEAMTALGQDASALLGDLELSDEAVSALLSGATYTVEVWVGADDQTVYRHVITLNLNSELDGKSFGSDLGGATVKISHNQSDTLTLSELNADFEIRVPAMDEVVG
ncbi:MAG: hypothetical protein HY862_20450 [Chloroflexi bacterium]|nr:hypothetical protein [Chloroflexota bacterium]